MGQNSGPRSIRLAAGTLANVPLASALVYLRNRKLSGVLELRVVDGRRARVAFWRGLVAQVVISPNVAPFGTVAYELGFIDAETLDATMARAVERDRPHAEVLVSRGGMTAEQREITIIEQLRRRVHHLFTFPSSTMFNFHEGTSSTFEPTSVIDTLAPLWRGLLDFPPTDRVDEAMEKIRSYPLRLVGRAALERAELTPDDALLCEALVQRPMTLDELHALSPLPSSRVDLLIYLLLISKCVEAEETSSIMSSSGTMWAAPPSSAETVPSLAAAAAAAFGSATIANMGAAASDSSPPSAPSSVDFRGPSPPGPATIGVDAIRLRAENLETETTFDALGISPEASVEAARAAYFRLSRNWNPAKLPPELECVRPEVERIYAHMTLAYRALTDHALRPRRKQGH